MKSSKNTSTMPFTIRYQEPTDAEIAPYATFCKVITKYGDETEAGQSRTGTFFIQTSQDENNPLWMPMGTFLEESLKDLLLDKTFIFTCLKLLNDKSVRLSIKEKNHESS